jgi:hypothetical protein
MSKQKHYGMKPALLGPLEYPDDGRTASFRNLGQKSDVCQPKSIEETEK